jgi:anion-transporting  ArsA/GET3 family ATPase
VVVAGPAPTAMDEALYFHRRLREGRMPFVSFVVNRVHPDPGGAAAGKGRERMRPPALDRDLADRLAAVFRDQQRVARRERRAAAGLAARTGEPTVVIPERDADVHDLRGMKEIGEAAVKGTA